MPSYDAIIIGTGQAGPSLAGRLTAVGMQVAKVERNLFGGACIITGCAKTKTRSASAHRGVFRSMGPSRKSEHNQCMAAFSPMADAHRRSHKGDDARPRVSQSAARGYRLLAGLIRRATRLQLRVMISGGDHGKRHGARFGPEPISDIQTHSIA
jgi:hypothetical protein